MITQEFRMITEWVGLDNVQTTVVLFFFSIVYKKNIKKNIEKKRKSDSS